MSKLWKNVRREHLLKAIELFEKVPEDYPEPRNTYLLFNKNKYPAKHVRGIAYKIANGTAIAKKEYSGGLETVNFLINLGFQVEYHNKIVSP